MIIGILIFKLLIMKDLLNLNGAHQLSKNEQQSINGGTSTGCKPTPQQCHFAVGGCNDWDWACCICND